MHLVCDRTTLCVFMNTRLKRLGSISSVVPATALVRLSGHVSCEGTPSRLVSTLHSSSSTLWLLLSDVLMAMSLHPWFGGFVSRLSRSLFSFRQVFITGTSAAMKLQSPLRRRLIDASYTSGNARTALFLLPMRSSLMSLCTSLLSL